jgi:hypothetical protein
LFLQKGIWYLFFENLGIAYQNRFFDFWDNHGYEIKEPPSELMGVSCHFKDLLNIVMYLNLGFLLLGKMHNISFSVGKEGG